ncbi:hypothetical protein V8F33_009852, partial [Rhypophila sp. PSN 637]
MLLLLRALLAVIAIFGASSHGAATCGRTVTAAAGDTCLSLATAAGITVAQFIRGNPGIAACDHLGPGTRYCVDPSYIPTTSSPLSTSSSQPTASSPALQVSKDGACGNGFTCQGSAFGDCCSEHGWCGRTADHCGATCQAQFGLC